MPTGVCTWFESTGRLDKGNKGFKVLSHMNFSRLNSHLLTTWQQGRRKYLIERSYRFIRWHPRSLFNACLREALMKLSNGAELSVVQQGAVTRYLTIAKSPGLDVPGGLNTYTIAMDYCGMMRNILEYVSGLTLLTVEVPTPVKLQCGAMWDFLSWRDESGVLHRWVMLNGSDITTDRIQQECQTWYVFGDMAAGRVPMVLHVIATGTRVGSRIVSPWTRAWSHPRIANVIRFQKKSGSELEGAWKEIWFADNPDSKSRAWVNQMIEDEITDRLVQHITLRDLTSAHVDRFERDVSYEHSQMIASGIDGMTNPIDLPMCRSYCNTPSPCPHQETCYSSHQNIDSTGLYVRINDRKTDH